MTLRAGVVRVHVHDVPDVVVSVVGGVVDGAFIVVVLPPEGLVVLEAAPPPVDRP